MEEEICRDIKGYEGLYSITKLGQIKHDKFARMKHTTINKKGYEVVVLFKNGKRKMYLVNSLVRKAWSE